MMTLYNSDDDNNTNNNSNNNNSNNNNNDCYFLRSPEQQAMKIYLSYKDMANQKYPCLRILPGKLVLVFTSSWAVNPIQDGKRKGCKKPPPYQFFPSNFYNLSVARDLYIFCIFFR